MPLVTLTGLSLAFGHLPLFEQADLRIEAGERIALIGRNGTGKSSLLRVISGELAGDAGTVWRQPGLRMAQLDQSAAAREGSGAGSGETTVFDEVASGLGALGDRVGQYHHAAIAVAEHPHDAGHLERLAALQQQLEREDGWRIEQRVEQVISRLSLPADRRMRELSGGWRRRVLLARALVASPDLLLLDEPTNHLDIDAIRWLEAFVEEFRGAVLFVTHDRAFLSRLATRIVELDRGRLTSWPGSYATYLEKKEAALESEARDLERVDRKLAEEEAWLRRGVKARRTRNEGRVRALIALREDRASRRAHVGTVRMSLDSGDGSGKLVFEADAVSKAYGDHPVIRDYSQRILRGDRVGLIGPNGSGKTTLLRLLVGELEPDEGTIRRGVRLRIAYFDQQREQLDPERTVADSVNDGNTTIDVHGEPRHVIGYLADFLFPRERAQSPVKSLSGGERNRLLLARLFARPANVLVLDEPTNDLDIETLELLEELVADFHGTVLIVSHDRVFLDCVVTSTLAFEGEGRVIEYVGGYEDYLRQARQRPRPERGPGPPSRQPRRGGDDGVNRRGAAAPSERERERGGSPASTEKGGPRAARQQRLSYHEQRELEALPGRIAALEEEQARLRDESAAPEFYKAPPDHIHGVLARIASGREELDAALARWVALEERVSS